MRKTHSLSVPGPDAEAQNPCRGLHATPEPGMCLQTQICQIISRHWHFVMKWGQLHFRVMWQWGLWGTWKGRNTVEMTKMAQHGMWAMNPFPPRGLFTETGSAAFVCATPTHGSGLRDVRGERQTPRQQL